MINLGSLYDSNMRSSKKDYINLHVSESYEKRKRKKRKHNQQNIVKYWTTCDILKPPDINYVVTHICVCVCIKELTYLFCILPWYAFTHSHNFFNNFSLQYQEKMRFLTIYILNKEFNAYNCIRIPYWFQERKTK